MPAQTTGDLTQQHRLHQDDNGHWMFKSEGKWCPFMNDSHFLNTRDYVGEDGFVYPIAYFKLMVLLPR